MEQRSEEWHKARCGVVTASRFKDVMASGRGGKPSVTRQNYISYIVAERLTGEVQDSFQGRAMQHGVDTEAEGIAAYEWETGYDVIIPGFIRSGDLPFCGASPDALVPAEGGGLELKCPASSVVHLKNVLELKTPSIYVAQVQGGMMVTEAEWWDFGSYDPRMPPGSQLVTVRVMRDEKYIKKLREELLKFEEECQALQREIEDEIQRPDEAILLGVPSGEEEEDPGD